MISSQTSGAAWATRPRISIPALLTSTSRPPNRCSTVAVSAARLSAERTSAAAASPVPPASATGSGAPARATSAAITPGPPGQPRGPGGTGEVDIGGDHRSALGGEAQGDRPADPGCRAGDHTGPAGE